VSTVAAHLKALEGSSESEVYRVLMGYAAEMLPVKRGGEMKKLLEKKKLSGGRRGRT